MPNEVEIRITATDLTGPAFSSAMAKLAALKSAADAAASDRQMNFGIGDALAKIATLKSAMDGLSFGKIDTSLLGTSLMALKSKIQALGIADLADIDVQPGRLMTQMQLIRRLIDQAGIRDVLDFNVTPADLAQQLDKLSGMSYDLPVKFDLSHAPDFGKLGTEQYVIPVRFDISKVPVSGPTGAILDVPANLDVKNILKGGETMPVLDVPSNIDVKGILKSGESMPVLNIPAVIDLKNIPTAGDLSSLSSAITKEDGLAAATESVARASSDAEYQFSPLMQRVLGYASAAQEGERYSGAFGDALVSLLPYTGMLARSLTTLVIPSIQNFRTSVFTAGAILGDYWSRGLTLAGTAAVAAGKAITGLNDNISLGLPMWQSSNNLWFGLGGHIQLFAGVLTQLGIPAIIGTASGLHILVDGIVETVATLGPAIVGVGAFAAAAVDSTDEIYNHFINMNKVIDMTGQNVYPLTGAFSKMNQAAKPEVYVLLGEGLQVVQHNAGGLQTVALQAGKALDDLGARFTYAVDNGGGFNTFIKNSATDITGWGNLVGNVGGIIGNFLKVMPGYAGIILNVAGSITHLIESITGSGLGEAILGIGMAMHGFILYVGLLGTGAAVLISKTLPALAGGIAMVSRAFAAIGATDAADSVGMFASSVVGMSELPWGWITIAAAGVGVLVYQLLNAKTAAQQFADNFQKTVSQVKLADLGSTLSKDIVDYTGALSKATATTSQLQQATGHMVNTMGMRGQTQSVVEYSQATYQSQQNVANYTAALAVAKQDQATYNSNLAMAAKQFGSNATALSALSNAGITTNQMLTNSKQQMAENIIEAQGYTDSIRALTDGSGRYAAAMNALSGPEQYMGDMLKSIQSITQAQDTLMSTVTEGETSFDTFGLGIATINSNFAGTSKAAATASHSLGDIKSSASLAGAALGGTSQASLTLAQSFYSEVNNAQQVIDALEQQEASTKNITTATATLSAQMLPYAGNNDAARATIVAMINDALGPGTVSLQNLNTWVNKNSTSMQGLSSIMAESTAKAGTLANVLQTQLNSQFQADLLVSSGAKLAMQDFTDAIVNTGNSSAATAGTRQELINDLEKTGMSASDSTNYVNGLQAKVDAMHGKTIPVSVDGTQALNAIGAVQNSLNGINSKTVSLYVNTYNAVYGTNAAANSVYGSNGTLTYASGGLVGGMLGSTGPDDRVASIRTGEFVVNPEATAKWLPFLQGINSKGGSGGGSSVVTSGNMSAAAGAVYGMTGSGGWGQSGVGSTGTSGGVQSISQSIAVALQVQGGSQTAFDRFMLEWMRNTVRVKGGGNVQKAFGKANS